MAHCDNDVCSSAHLVVVDNNGNVGMDSSICVGDDGFPTIAYFDETNEDLKVSEACYLRIGTFYPLRRFPNLAAATCCRMMSMSPPWFVTSDAHCFVVMQIAHCTDTLCTARSYPRSPSTVREGKMTSCTVGGDGFVLISYWAIATGDLMVRVLPCVHCAVRAYRIMRCCW